MTQHSYNSSLIIIADNVLPYKSYLPFTSIKSVTCVVNADKTFWVYLTSTTFNSKHDHETNIQKQVFCEEEKNISYRTKTQ